MVSGGVRDRRIMKRAKHVHERVRVLVGDDVNECLRPAACPAAARSANSTVAGTRFFGLYIAVSRSSRGSGTLEIPMAASSFPCDVLAVSLALVIN